MKEHEHLTKSQIAGYRTGAFDTLKKREIGRHLLKCASCRRSLPPPTFDDFWNAVMNEQEIEQNATSEEMETSRHSILSYFPQIFGQFSSLAWGGAALVIILSCSILLWVNSADSSREVVQTFDNELNSELNFPSPVQTPIKENLTSRTDSNRAVVVPTPKNLKPDTPKPKISQNTLNQDSKKPNLKQPGQTISATRGISAKCSESREVEIELSLSKENLVFKWKKVPKAVKYHLYISDDEEILIDEYETETETTFVLNRKLDPLKTYKWKIIITLENGQTIPGPSNKFTVKDFQTKQMKSEKTRNADVRCSENN